MCPLLHSIHSDRVLWLDQSLRVTAPRCHSDGVSRGGGGGEQQLDGAAAAATRCPAATRLAELNQRHLHSGEAHMQPEHSENCRWED